MTNPYAPPGESSFDLFNERSILDGLFLGSVAYGKSVLCSSALREARL
jgi:hypothetical protein